jgi:peptide/nickel transport system permease protein
MATAAIDVRKSDSTGALLIKPESQTEIVFRRFRKHKLAVVSSVLLLVIFIASLLAPMIAPFGRDDIDISAGMRFAPPMTAGSDGRVHIMGTDNLGRDIFTRLLYGARVTLSVAVLVATLSTVIGMTIGSVAGFYRGIVDTLLMRFLEFMASIPDFPILLILTSILLTDPKLLPFPDWIIKPIQNIMLLRTEQEARAVAIILIVLIAFGWIGTARLTRGMVLSIRERDFVEASRSLGVASPTIILRHIIPNAMAPIIVAFTQQLASAFATETVLSFLGFGVQEPTATWGNMMKLAEENIFENRTLPILVGMPILICSLAFNFIGDGLRDALDPRLKM